MIFKGFMRPLQGHTASERPLQGLSSTRHVPKRPLKGRQRLSSSTWTSISARPSGSTRPRMGEIPTPSGTLSTCPHALHTPVYSTWSRYISCILSYHIFCTFFVSCYIDTVMLSRQVAIVLYHLPFKHHHVVFIYDLSRSSHALTIHIIYIYHIASSYPTHL